MDIIQPEWHDPLGRWRADVEDNEACVPDELELHALEVAASKCVFPMALFCITTIDHHGGGLGSFVHVRVNLGLG